MTTTAEKIAELKDAIAALEAFGRGEPVQWFSVSLKDWLEDVDPMFSLSQNRRIRIKPKPREWWVNVYTKGAQFTTCITKQEADHYDDGCRTECVHVREVL